MELSGKALKQSCMLKIVSMLEKDLEISEGQKLKKKKKMQFANLCRWQTYDISGIFPAHKNDTPHWMI